MSKVAKKLTKMKDNDSCEEEKLLREWNKERYKTYQLGNKILIDLSKQACDLGSVDGCSYVCSLGDKGSCEKYQSLNEQEENSSRLYKLGEENHSSYEFALNSFKESCKLGNLQGCEKVCVLGEKDFCIKEKELKDRGNEIKRLFSQENTFYGLALSYFKESCKGGYLKSCNELCSFLNDKKACGRKEKLFNKEKEKRLNFLRN
ncbi:hypothetical protein [Helicobacter cetorum]|uniref:hypothetical protein n=1 Tax=Helicobacter cetorum TaxID=138563 RepID=UPI001315A8BC|nr:hypothetical protein [Helicobacter cetorum]